MRASHNSQLQLQARSTRTCLSCLAPSANSIIANRMQMSWTAKLNSKQAGGKKERNRERKKTRRRIKLRSGIPISKLHIAYVFCCLICAGIVCFLQHELTILSPSHSHTISLSMPFPAYLSPPLVLPRWHYSFHVALFCLACKFNLRF